MKARITLLGLAAGLGLFFAGGAALAQCCAPPPPTCCAPPPPPPPSTPPCCTPGHNVNIPGVNVFVAPTVVVNASARASAGASAGGGAGAMVFFGGGGGGYAPPSATGLISGLNVGGGVKRVAYQATRTRTKRVVIQAVCIDDRQIPHPASQVRADREVTDLYDGELYRCIAGASLQATISEYEGRIDFSKGETMACAKGQALYHSPGGKVDCRRQKPARDCNERSLLRRFGAGVKILTMTVVETYTAYREEQSEAVLTSMSIDGGVGGVAY
ncbi:MAG: hypothetical protein Q8M88_12165 [Phenylobacterium sp.]|uniref:hypothetical protein n=1 Tax=Phenylobacterium sp. TaxID=1871053 RepID=UPI00273346F2|nr:hypothetical protein [Phenylobacterium sp.]MDP3175177.1 hypothetical protein [Phenylobacterium sp.]